MNFAFREWPDGAVVFDLRSGDTHALDVLSAELLKQPPTELVEAARAAERLATLFNISLNDELIAATDAALDRLRQLRLL